MIGTLVALALLLVSLTVSGARPAEALNQPIVGVTATPDRGGYWMYARDGGVFSFGNATFHGSTGGIALNAPIVGMAATPTGAGYFLVAADGGVFAFGDAVFRGSMAGQSLNKPIIGMATTPTGAGYWLAGADGGIYAYGDAVFRGSMGGTTLNKPIVGIAAHPNGQGYWLVASDGGIFAFNVAFHGSMGGQPLNKPIVGIAAHPTGQGYWLVGSDGGIFAFNVGFHGSTGSIALAAPVVGIAAGPGGNGYWMAAADGGLFAFGSAPFQGSMVSGEPATGNGTPAAATLRSAIVTRANSWVGYNTPSENNHNFTHNGTYVTRAWCADFASYVWIKSGVTDWSWISAVSAFRDKAQAQNRFRGRSARPEIGDVAIWKSSNVSHVNIVIDVRADGWIRTVGGNEGPDTVVRTSFYNPLTSRGGALVGYGMPISPTPRYAASSSQTLAEAPDSDTGFTPDVWVSDVTVNEAAGMAYVTVSMSHGVSYPWSLTYSTLDGTATSAGGLDYSAQTGTLSFNGEASKVIAIPITNDALHDPLTETFTLAIASSDTVNVTDNAATISIVDNDPLPV
ncbi:MAG TPA: CHAP domain-containing protein [Frankiaceae bacterium]|nr:CHAP domain-containing protein [Frankiaceae bacterium]